MRDVANGPRNSSGGLDGSQVGVMEQRENAHAVDTDFIGPRTSEII
jgi:hypothetical protein